MNVYTLFDRKLRQYGALVLERNDFGVQRSLADALVGGGESLFSKHPADFDLYQVGEFDDEKGVISPVVPPRLVINAGELAESKPSGVSGHDPTRFGPSLSKEG